MPCGVTFAQLPDEEAAFLAYLQGTGEIWARAVNDDLSPRWPPQPVGEFLAAYAAEIRRHSAVAVYLGFEPAVVCPRPYEYEVTEGGTLVPAIRDGRELPGGYNTAGGAKVKRVGVHASASELVRYDRGEFRAADELAISNLSYHSGYYDEAKLYRHHSEPFLKWAKGVLGWMRRRTKFQVPVHRANYEVQATARALEAHQHGIKFR